MPRFALALVTTLSLFTLACGPESALDLIDGVELEPPAVETPVDPCVQPGHPVIDGARATYDPEETAIIDVELRGHTCGADVRDFDWAAYDADGNREYSRSWTNVHAVEVTDGRFVLRGEIWTCATFERISWTELAARADVVSAPVVAELERVAHADH